MCYNAIPKLSGIRKDNVVGKPSVATPLRPDDGSGFSWCGSCTRQLLTAQRDIARDLKPCGAARTGGKSRPRGRRVRRQSDRRRSAAPLPLRTTARTTSRHRQQAGSAGRPGAAPPRAAAAAATARSGLIGPAGRPLPPRPRPPARPGGPAAAPRPLPKYTFEAPTSGSGALARTPRRGLRSRGQSARYGE